MNIPGVSELVDAVSEMPQQFNELCDRLDTIIELLTQTNAGLGELTNTVTDGNSRIENMIGATR